MGLFKTVICPRCGREYSAFKSGCPQCGARKQTPTQRTAPTTDAARRGTSAAQRAAEQARWQLILGLCLVAAVIIAVIVLIVTTVYGNYDTYPTPTPSVAVTEEPSPSPTATPTPTPTVESVKITYYGEERTEFLTTVGAATPLTPVIYPVEIEGPVTWQSVDESICTVSNDGVVTGVGAGQTNIICRCYGASAECKVYVK